MLGIKVRKEDAERARTYLRKAGLLDADSKIFSKYKFIYIPLSGRPKAAEAKALLGMGCRSVDAKFPRMPNRLETYRSALRESVGEAVTSPLMSKAYDILGDIAIIDAEPRYAKGMAKAIMRTNANIRTVLRKGGAVSGTYRTRAYHYVAGARNFVAEYRENGCVFRFDVRKVFFSPRLAYERKRIADLSKDGDSVMVMFSGVGPFAIECARQHPKSRVVAIELNRQAHVSALENIMLNKVNNVTAVLGDVRKAVRKYRRFADRIIMPLPKDAYTFLDSVAYAANSPCTVHYYAFGDAKTVFRDQKERIRSFLKGKGKRVRFVFERVVRPYSATEIEIVLDFVCSDAK